jgi:hypothetical protein
MARAHLNGSRIRHVPQIASGEFHDAVARYGAGIDHASGETPIALIKSNPNKEAAARGYGAAYIVTDRRLFGRIEMGNVPRTFTEVPYSQVGPQVTRTGGLLPAVQLHVGNQPQKVYIASKELQAFFTAMVSHLPPANRTFGPSLPPPCSPEDPIGANAAAQAVGAPDPRTWAPLRALAEAHRRGMIRAEDAAPLVPPMMVLARAVNHGQGACPQGWFSTLPRPAFTPVLCAVFGDPAFVAPAPGGEVFDFPIGAGSGAGRAVASSVVGLAMLATVGVGWVSRSTGRRLATIRVETSDFAGGTAYRLFGTSGGPWEPLSSHWWGAVDTINQALLRIEARHLLAQPVLGPGRQPADSISIPREALEAATAQFIGPTNLATFYPS